MPSRKSLECPIWVGKWCNLTLKWLHTYFTIKLKLQEAGGWWIFSGQEEALTLPTAFMIIKGFNISGNDIPILPDSQATVWTLAINTDYTLSVG